MYRGNKIVVSDNSNIDEKYDALNEARISKRTRNTYKAVILTLDNDKEYINLLLKPKYRFATRTEKNISRKQKVLTDYFKDSSKNLYVLQTNYSLQRSQNLVARMITSVPEISISLYVSTNTELHEETGKGNKQIKTSELIQLSRFDPAQKFDHYNKTQIGTLKYDYFGDKIPAGVPHFHFASKTQALMYGDSVGSDAISLDNLIRYVGALRKNSRNIELWNDDLSMPYLELLSKPMLYQTNTKIQELANIIPPKN